MLFLLPRSDLLTEEGGRADSDDSEVAPWATETLSRATDATGEALVRHVDAYQLGRPVGGGGLDVLSCCVVGAVVDAAVSSCRAGAAGMSLADACSLSVVGFGLDFFRLGPISTATADLLVYKKACGMATSAMAAQATRLEAGDVQGSAAQRVIGPPLSALVRLSSLVPPLPPARSGP